MKKKNSKQNRTVKRRFTEGIFRKAIKDSYGNISIIAEKLGCERNTVYEWLNKHTALKEQLESEREKILDLAESKLIENLKKGETSSIHFVLKTLGRKRGYVEKQEIEHSGGLEERIRNMTQEQREARMKELFRQWKEIQ